MAITSQDICSAADQLKGFVGFHVKRGVHIVRFSEDAFGMDVADDSITPCNEFVWRPEQRQRMTLSRERLALLLKQHVDERLNIGEPLRIYLQRSDLPEIVAERALR
ncbi:DUF2025 family protein [Pseudomonas plecoglossicida]|uniref:DUF2025 family protein n=1 Tax=Pseudomonas plecoglossicida TaxID=70775 RepID=A0AAD0QW73_PSEDL|nr:DUF2025 family protein [Pseudomonas plecoglossicida]AXM96108.1 DUF2025 family protein [Pseudomonas plecoglossicida]EPB96853.1 hypothetical protein L321_06044 [Pseudomonas plecoglossicida NB2011]QLB56862.1 DUF2025 family protein [Pseudomonas plecoglossicida]GLR39209.1 hypothetical protein GCM10011247_46080 [Pseudomonas plecoglossicida]